MIFPASRPAGVLGCAIRPLFQGKSHACRWLDRCAIETIVVPLGAVVVPLGAVVIPFESVVVAFGSVVNRVDAVVRPWRAVRNRRVTEPRGRGVVSARGSTRTAHGYCGRCEGGEGKLPGPWLPGSYASAAVRGCLVTDHAKLSRRSQPHSDIFWQRCCAPNLSCVVDSGAAIAAHPGSILAFANGP